LDLLGTLIFSLPLPSPSPLPLSLSSLGGCGEGWGEGGGEGGPPRRRHGKVPGTCGPRNFLYIMFFLLY